MFYSYTMEVIPLWSSFFKKTVAVYPYSYNSEGPRSFPLKFSYTHRNCRGILCEPADGASLWGLQVGDGNSFTVVPSLCQSRWLHSRHQCLAAHLQMMWCGPGGSGWPNLHWVTAPVALGSNLILCAVEEGVGLVWIGV